MAGQVAETTADALEGCFNDRVRTIGEFQQFKPVSLEDLTGEYKITETVEDKVVVTLIC